MGTLLNRRRYMGGGGSHGFNGLRLVAVEDTTFTFTFQSSVTTQLFNYIEYSVDDGITWTKIQNVNSSVISGTTPTILQGNALCVRGDGISLINNGNNPFISSTGLFDLEGDIMSVLGRGEIIMPSNNYTHAFRAIFRASKARKANNLILSAKDMKQNCYHHMFYGCTELTDAPFVSYTTAAQGCCYEMFRGCSSLVNTQEELPSVLATQCFQGMYSGCSSLVNAPALPATTLATGCYNSMFGSCSSLKYIKCMSLTELSTSYTYWWVMGVPKGGTFVKNSAATWTDTFSRSAVPSEAGAWTVVLADS